MSDQTAPTPETLRRIEQGEHFIRWICPRLGSNDSERETAMVMLLAHMHERYVQGIHDAADIVQSVAAQRPQSRELAVVAKALADLEQRARKEPPTAI